MNKKKIIVSVDNEDHEKLVKLVAAFSLKYKGFVSVSAYVRYLIRKEEEEK